MDIASALEKQDIVIDRRKILLEKPIKSLGEFEVPVKIYPEITALIRVVVESSQEKEE
jgi:large subunit ribosomal protein L9